VRGAAGAKDLFPFGRTLTDFGPHTHPYRHGSIDRSRGGGPFVLPVWGWRFCFIGGIALQRRGEPRAPTATNDFTADDGVIIVPAPEA